MAKACPARDPAGPDPLCCFHERERHEWRSGKEEGSMFKSEQCCFCGEIRVIHFHRELPGGHGQHAPGIWVQNR